MICAQSRHSLRTIPYTMLTLHAATFLARLIASRRAASRPKTLAWNKHTINPADTSDGFLMQMNQFDIPRHFTPVNEKHVQERLSREYYPHFDVSVAMCLFGAKKNSAIPVRLV